MSFKKSRLILLVLGTVVITGCASNGSDSRSTVYNDGAVQCDAIENEVGIEDSNIKVIDKKFDNYFISFGLFRGPRVLRNTVHSYNKSIDNLSKLDALNKQKGCNLTVAKYEKRVIETFNADDLME